MRRIDRRRHRPGAFCPLCGEFVEQRWATIAGHRLSFLCWNGHRWTDRRMVGDRRRR
jgi:hypothetical protein